MRKIVTSSPVTLFPQLEDIRRLQLADARTTPTGSLLLSYRAAGLVAA